MSSSTTQNLLSNVLLSGALSYLSSISSTKSVKVTSRNPASSSNLHQWEMENYPLYLPTDLRMFYSICDGFTITWETINNEEVGFMQIKNVASLKSIEILGRDELAEEDDSSEEDYSSVEDSVSEDAKESEESSCSEKDKEGGWLPGKCFLLSSSQPYGNIYLVYKTEKEENFEQTLNSEEKLKNGKNSKAPQQQAEIFFHSKVKVLDLKKKKKNESEKANLTGKKVNNVNHCDNLKQNKKDSKFNILEDEKFAESFLSNTFESKEGSSEFQHFTKTYETDVDREKNLNASSCLSVKDNGNRWKKNKKKKIRRSTRDDWFKLAPNFNCFFRLMVLNFGIKGWPLQYTSLRSKYNIMNFKEKSIKLGREFFNRCSNFEMEKDEKQKLLEKLKKKKLKFLSKNEKNFLPPEVLDWLIFYCPGRARLYIDQLETLENFNSALELGNGMILEKEEAGGKEINYSKESEEELGAEITNFMRMCQPRYEAVKNLKKRMIKFDPNIVRSLVSKGNKLFTS